MIRHASSLPPYQHPAFEQALIFGILTASIPSISAYILAFSSDLGRQFSITRRTFVHFEMGGEIFWGWEEGGYRQLFRRLPRLPVYILHTYLSMNQ